MNDVDVIVVVESLGDCAPDDGIGVLKGADCVVWEIDFC